MDNKLFDDLANFNELSTNNQLKKDNDSPTRDSSLHVGYGFEPPIPYNDDGIYNKQTKAKLMPNKNIRGSNAGLKQITKDTTKKSAEKLAEKSAEKTAEKIVEKSETTPLNPVKQTGYRFVFFMLQKGAKASEIPMKIGFTNNVPEEKAKLEQGNYNDLRCELIIKCEKMDADKLCDILQLKYNAKHKGRNWFLLSKKEVEDLGIALAKKGFKLTTEGRAKLTKAEIKKFGISD